MGFKSLIFSIYALFFNFRASLSVVENRVGLVSMHNANFTDGLGEVKAAMEKRGRFEFLKISRTSLKNPLSALKFCTVDAYRLGGARYIFLNDNFMPLAKLRPHPDAEIIQLWHGQGAFKKFGLDIPQPESVRKRELAANKKLTHVVCSSKSVRDIYAGAFGVSPEQVLTTGSPNEDYYFRRRDLHRLRREFDERYPQCKDKLLVLYAPTFRENSSDDKSLLSHMDFARLKASFGAPAEVLLRLHPQVHGAVKGKDFTGGENGADFIDVTDFENVNELCLLADLLITDYSSICMDFSLLKKPMLFYAYDLAEYKDKRNFYFDYETYVPGRVVTNLDELCEAVRKTDFQTEKNESFRIFNFGVPIGDATERMLDTLLA